MLPVGRLRGPERAADAPSPRPNLTRFGVHLPPGRQAEIPTGIELLLPPGTYGRLFAPFRLGAGSGLVVVNSVLDADRFGELIVVLENAGTNNLSFKPGDAVATLVLHPVATPDVL